MFLRSWISPGLSAAVVLSALMSCLAAAPPAADPADGKKSETAAKSGTGRDPARGLPPNTILLPGESPIDLATPFTMLLCICTCRRVVCPTLVCTLCPPELPPRVVQGMYNSCPLFLIPGSEQPLLRRTDIHTLTKFRRAEGLAAHYSLF